MSEFITSLTREIHELDHALEISDLRAFLELIATYSPQRLRRETMRILWAPTTSLDAFREIAETTENLTLLGQFLEKADEYLLPFRLGEAAAFEAWTGLLGKVVPRLCALTSNVTHLERAIELNPEKADELRIATVQALVDSNSPDLARLVCSAIKSRRLRHLTQLKISATLNPRALTPALLLEAFAETEMVQDQIVGLAAVTAASYTPLPLLVSQLCLVENQQDRYLTLLRAAEWTLLRSDTSSSQDEILDRLVQSAGLVTSDAQLAALTPEITATVASCSGRLAVTEIREALEHLLSLRSVSWSIRRDICETLFARLLPLLGSRAERGWLEAGEVVEMISSLLNQIEYGSNQENEERDLLPVLYAVMDRLPLKVRRRLLRALPSEHHFSRMYLADDRCLAESLDAMIEENDFNPMVLETVLYLFSHRFPSIVPVILKDLTPGPFRDNLAANLLRNGWLPATFGPQVIPLIENSANRLGVEVALKLSCMASSEEEDLWLQTLGSLMSLQLLDPTDPRNEPWIQKLWTVDPERSRPILAWSVLRSLSQSGRWHGTSALCAWLHAHLSPNADSDASRRLALSAQATQAVQRSLTLSPHTSSTNV